MMSPYPSSAAAASARKPRLFTYTVEQDGDGWRIIHERCRAGRKRAPL